MTKKLRGWKEKDGISGGVGKKGGEKERKKAGEKIRKEKGEIYKKKNKKRKKK